MPNVSPKAPSINEILALVRQVAHRVAEDLAATSSDSPQLRSAIGQVWAMVRPRLPDTKSTSELDAVIQQLAKH